MNKNDYSMRGFRNRKNFLALALITLVSAILNFACLDMGLPSTERLNITLGGEEAAERGLRELNPDTSLALKSEFLAKDDPDNFRQLAKYTFYFDQLRSYNPDEFYVFKVLSDMYTRRDPRPESYIYGAFFFYQMGFPLAVAKATGYIGGLKAPEYYLTHPAEFRPFYLSVRFICALFQTLAVAVTFLAAWRIFKLPGAVFSALLMATLPMVTISAGFIKADPPVLFWSVLALFFAIPILKRNRAFDYIAAGACAGLAAATKYPAVFTFSYIFMFHLLRRQEECGSWKNLRFAAADRSLLTGLGAAFIAGLVVSLPILFDIPNFIQSYKYVLGAARHGNSLFNFADTLLNYWHDAIFFTYGIPAALAVLAGLVMICVKPQRIWWGMVPIVLFFFYSASKGSQASDMYTLPVIPVLCLMAGYAWDMIKLKTVKYSLMVAIVIVTWSYTLANQQCAKRENVRLTASKWIQANIPADSLLGFMTYPVSYRAPMVPPDRYRFLSAEIDGDKIYESDYLIYSSFDMPSKNFPARITQGELPAPPAKYHYILDKEFEDVPRALFGLLPLKRNYYINYYFEVYRPKIMIYRKIGADI